MKRWNFSTLADFADACAALPADIRSAYSRSEWSGETFNASLQQVRGGGSESSVPAAERLIAQIQATLPETLTRRWSLDLAGAFPCVPAYLSGEPESMWSLFDVPAETSPVRVYVCSTSSGAVPHEDLLRRGCACLALILLASRTRPVELYSYAHCAERAIKGRRGDALIVQRLQSSPMMLAEVSYVLTSPGWARNLTYAFFSDRLGYSNLKWADAQLRDNCQAGPVTRQLLGLEPSDVLIGPAHCDDPAVKDPAGFVNRELGKLGLTTECLT